MKRSLGSGVARATVTSVCVFACGPAPFARAAEQTVKNDAVADFGHAVIVGNFSPGEHAGVRLTSPCDGNIVAVQVLWLEGTPGHLPTLEEAIRIHADDTGFPVPGTQLEFLEGPVLTPGGFNEFRYLDELQTIPLKVPVTVGQNFYVDLEFAEPTDVGGGGPSVVRDLGGCQNGRNVLFAIPGGWLNFCIFLNGDLAIRAVVDCQDPTGACCDFEAACVDDVEADACQDAGQTFFEGGTCSAVTCPPPTGACCRAGGCLRDVEQAVCEGALSGVYAGHGTDCDDDVCLAGACCHLTGECEELFEVQCTEAGASFLGPDTFCTPNPCAQPDGACCFVDFCLAGQTEEDCTGADGEWAGPFTTCTPDPCPLCATGAICPDADVNCDGVADGFDIAVIRNSTNWLMIPADAAEPRCDVNDDGVIDGFDIAAVRIGSCWLQ